MLIDAYESQMTQPTEPEFRFDTGAVPVRKPGPMNLAGAIRARFAPFGGVEMKIPARRPMREPTSLGETEQ